MAEESSIFAWLSNLISVIVGAFLGALLPIFIQRVTTPNPRLQLYLRLNKARLPEYGIQSHHPISKQVSGAVLTAEIKNALNAKENAKNCRARLNIEGVTKGDEYIPWRFLELATKKGSSWSQYHSIQILKGDSGFLHICWTELDNSHGYLQTSSPEIQRNPYRLSFNNKYKVKLTIIGDFKPISWSFTLNIISWNNIEFTSPKKEHT